MPTRRDTVIGLSALPLAFTPGGCANTHGPIRDDARLEPGRAFVLRRGGETVVSDLGGHAFGMPFTADRPFRVASISKAFVAEAVRALKRDGVVTGTEDAARIDPRLRHPEHPDAPITLDHLIGHRSGLRDPAVYWMAAPGDIRALIAPEILEPGARPGEAFRYSNFNYGLAATLLELVTGERFDRIVQRTVLAPLGLEAGFNWAGVGRARRMTGMPLLRGAPGAWEVQIDARDTLRDDAPAVLHEDGWTADAYVPGRNGTLFSPQGGLRASVNDLLAFGERVLLADPALWEPGWIWDGRLGRPTAPNAGETPGEATGSGPSEGGHFVAFGDGLYIYPADRSPIPGVRLVGHHGEAYGLFAGLWIAPDHDAVFVHADLGSAPDGPARTDGVPENTVLAQHAFDRAGALLRSG